MKTKITLLVLTALLGLTNVFANSMPTSENTVENEMMTSDGNLILISAGKRIYSLDMNTYHATLLTTSPYVNEINSLATDARTGWLFYVSNHLSRYNWTIYGYNVYTDTHKNFGSVRHFFTGTGHARSSRGLASGGATFYGGDLYYAFEFPTPCQTYRDGRRTTRGSSSHPKDELIDIPTRGGGQIGFSGAFTNGSMSRGNNSMSRGNTVYTQNSGRDANTADDSRGNGESLADFVELSDEEGNELNDNVVDYISEEELPEETDANTDQNLAQRANSYSRNYYQASYNNRIFLIKISFSGLSDTTGQTTAVTNGRPVYDNWWYSSFLYKGELGDIVVDDNGQLYAATSYQVQAFNFNTRRYDWANNENIYAQMAKDKHSHLHLLKNKKYYTTYYYHGCPQNVYTAKSFVQKYTPPSHLRTFNNIQLGANIEITGLNPHDVGKITDASDYVDLTPPVSYKIKGTVFDDNDEDGNIDGGEARTSGVTVTLYADTNDDNQLDSGDTVLNSQVTDANGSYEFNDVDTAETLVAVTVPADTPTTTFTATTPEVVAVSGRTDDVVVDFGINQALIPVNYDIFGTVFDDNNEDAILDNGEPGLANVILTLYADNNTDGLLDTGDTVITTTTSGTDGSYSFLHVCIQNTIVAVTVPTDTGDFTYTLTTAGTQAIDSINTDVTGVDFGVNEVQVINYAISGNVYDDNNEDGGQDAGEPNLESITVTLYADNNDDGVVDSGDTVISTATTAADGTYSFAGVIVPNTVVEVTVPADTADFTYTLTTPGSVDTSSTNVNVENVNFGINEVLVIDYNISGTVFDDDNADGLQDVGEGTLGSVVVTLYADNNADGTVDTGDTVISTATTATDGTYSFTGVTVQNTVVEVTVPADTADFTYTLTTAGSINTSSTNVDITGADFGINEVLIINYNISGTVFDDDNADGLQDVGEGTLESVAVTLYADNNADGTVDTGDTVISTATTATDGTYSFTGVTVQNTVVEVTVPADTANFTYTLTTAGSINTSSTNVDITGADFGINEEEIILYNISGTVFDDDDASGVRDAGEGFVGAVLITLYADNDGNGRLGGGDTVITTTTTSSMSGTYSFTGVTERNTLVIVTVPTDDGTFTYVLTTTGTRAVSSTITDVNGVDFGINIEDVIDYNIFGIVYDDDNENANLDSDEQGRLANVTMTLYVDDDGDGRVGSGDTILGSTTTDANGAYQFLNVAVQNTLVAITVPQNDVNFNYVLTTAARVNTSSTTTDVLDVNFGVNQLPTSYNVTGNVFNDENADGINAVTEAGLRGVIVNLYDDVNGNGRIDRGEPLIGTTLSDRSGNYQFTTITAPNVIVQVVVPANTAQFTYTPTTPVNVVLSGGVSTTVDFGIDRAVVVLYNISGVIWDDQNSDQIKDPSEPRLSGVGVTLFEDVNANGTLDTADISLSTITTSQTGAYQFTNVNLRNVLVVPTLVTNATFTTPDIRAISSINTDAINVDFGMKTASTLFQISGAVFEDANQNGVFDTGETTIDGLPVEVYVDVDLNGVLDENIDILVAFTQTSNAGFLFQSPNWSIGNLVQAEILIRVVYPADTIFERYIPTSDPDTGTLNPDGVSKLTLNQDESGLDFQVFIDRSISTSRAVDVGLSNEVFTNERGEVNNGELQDVSERLRLYPNPTVNQIAINAEEFAGDVTVEIYNDRGYQVMTTTASPFGNELKVDVQRLAPGMYYVKFGSSNKIASKKFLKN
ncbi:MAG: SdrD B-like domain-containing protein [Bacteroidota bacterium]